MVTKAIIELNDLNRRLLGFVQHRQGSNEKNRISIHFILLPFPRTLIFFKLALSYENYSS